MPRDRNPNLETHLRLRHSGPCKPPPRGMPTVGRRTPRGLRVTPSLLQPSRRPPAKQRACISQRPPEGGGGASAGDQQRGYIGWWPTEAGCTLTTRVRAI